MKKQKRRETQTSGGRLLDRYPSIQLSVVGEQLLATLAVRKRPCRPRVGYRLYTDALLVAPWLPALRNSPPGLPKLPPPTVPAA